MTVLERTGKILNEIDDVRKLNRLNLTLVEFGMACQVWYLLREYGKADTFATDVAEFYKKHGATVGWDANYINYIITV